MYDQSLILLLAHTCSQHYLYYDLQESQYPLRQVASLFQGYILDHNQEEYLIIMWNSYLTFMMLGVDLGRFSKFQ